MTTGGQVPTASEKRNTILLSHHMYWLSLIHRLRNVLVHSTCSVRRNGWATYNLPYTVLDVVRGHVVGRGSGTDDDNFFPSIILRVYELGCVDNLSLEAFLRLQRGCEF